MRCIVAAVTCIAWLVGIVLAKGFWSTVIAICFAPYAWYLVAEKCVVIAGWA
jgi:hypothetical protein